MAGPFLQPVDECSHKEASFWLVNTSPHVSRAAILARKCLPPDGRQKGKGSLFATDSSHPFSCVTKTHGESGVAKRMGHSLGSNVSGEKRKNVFQSELDTHTTGSKPHSFLKGVQKMQEIVSIRTRPFQEFEQFRYLGSKNQSIYVITSPNIYRDLEEEHHGSHADGEQLAE